ncbi:MAG: alkaline phosphatase family protein [Verrucomicrobiae bacterium]|nr:alkaline phosphatase family protein [Verrucomicrobiae bacterium]
MERVAVLNVVGLTPRLLGEATPHLSRYARAGRLSRIEPAFPAVTCTAQATYLTGTPPSGHGIVGNGWYDRTLSEVQFWKQSNRLVAGEKLWETVRRRRPGFTCAKLFWWYNMYSSADWSITPRPLYPADGRKVFDIHTWPYSIRTEIQRDLGPFPFPTFWGPAAGRSTPQGPPEGASRWIAESAKWIERRHRPDLSLVYLPHLDYNLQRLGVTPDSTMPSPAGNPAWHPGIRADLERIDALVGDLLAFYAQRGVRVIVLSEYGITNVTRSISLNRMFRERGWLTVKDELGRDHLDAGASRVFAVADHQVAHLYLNDPSLSDEVRERVAALPGVDQVWGPEEKRERGLDHPRAGDLIALAREDAWFDYYYWPDDRRAPDFARCVDIHRKPGYDPVELFTDPAFSPFGLKARVAWRLLKKRLGFRMLMDLIPLDTSLVKGSHGVRPADSADWPVVLTPSGWDAPASIAATEVRDLLLRAWEG